MKDDLSKYIGKIHKYQGHGKYCDCLNLVEMFYKDHGYKQDFNDGKPRPKTFAEYKKKCPTRIVRYLLKNFTVTKNPNELDYGDVILTNVGGDMHLGVYVGDGKALAMQIPVVEGKSKSTIYKRKFWEWYFVAGFKR